MCTPNPSTTGVIVGAQRDRNERRAWFVVALTVTMMVVEIVGGTMFGSMALVADGWHMSTHAAALSIAGFAYWFARKHRDDPRLVAVVGLGVKVLSAFIRFRVATKWRWIQDRVGNDAS